MDYIKSMQNLKKYREDKRNITSNIGRCSTLASKMKSNVAMGEKINNLNILDQINYILMQSTDGKKSSFSKNIEYMCNELDISYTAPLSACLSLEMLRFLS